MKRSEALKIIDDEYSKFVEDWLNLGVKLMDNEEIDFVPLNERILVALEKAGMLPPFTHLNKLGIADMAWEPEEEKK